MKVGEIMSREVVGVAVDDPVLKAAELMKIWDVGAVPVGDDGRFCGILTDRDIVLRCVASGRSPGEVEVGEIMTSRDLAMVSAEHSAIEAARLMAKKKVRRLPVCRNGKLVGILTLGDIAKTRKMFSETAAAFCEVCAGRKKKPDREITEQ